MKNFKKTKNIIICFFLFITILVIINYKAFPGVFSEQSTPPTDILPREIIREIDSVRADEHSFFSRWEADDTKHIVTIYLNCIQLGNNKPNKTIGTWTIIWEQDPEVYNETAEKAYKSYIKKWAEDHPQQSVVYTGADVCKKRITVPVINITPDILGTEVIVEGWRIIFVRAT